MKKISFIVTGGGTISAVANGRSYTIPKDHANYKAIKDAVINDDAASLESLVNVATKVRNYTSPIGGVEVRDGEVYWNGQVMHNALTQRIFDLMREDYPVDPLVKFLGNLMANPSKRAVDELYKFLEHRGLPLTEDGCFLGYKRVRADYTDIHSGKFDNSVGKVHEIPRNTVDDNWRNACSSGFHVGCIEYVRNFGNEHEGNHVMIVKVNPADVVSVPEHEVTKLRTCKYEVVSEYDAALPETLPAALYTAQGAPVYAPAQPDTDVPVAESREDYEDDDYEDDDYEDDDYEDDDYEDDDDSDLEEDDDDSDLDDERTIDRLSNLAFERGVKPVELAFELGVSKQDLRENFDAKDVISVAIYSTAVDVIENAIKKLGGPMASLDD